MGLREEDHGRRQNDPSVEDNQDDEELTIRALNSLGEFWLLLNEIPASRPLPP
jgi:hypothetical protein